MDTTGRLEPLEEILTAAETEAGFRPTDKQRKDWRRAGLIPGPSDQRGLGREHGSVTVYPAGTGVRLAAVCRHSKPKKSLGDLTFLVWWDGYSVPMETIRKRLTVSLHQFEQWCNQSPEERQAKIQRLSARRTLPEPLLGVRDRIGKRGLETMLTTLSTITTGGFDTWRYQEEQTAFLEGMGLDRAIQGIESWLNPALRQPLREFSTVMNPASLRDVLLAIPDTDLVKARDELQPLVELIAQIRSAFEAQFGLGSLGLSIFPSSDELNHKTAPFLLLGWLALRQQPTVQRGYSEIMRHVGPAVQLSTNTTNTERMTESPGAAGTARGTAKGDKSPCTTILASPYPPPARDPASSS